MKQNRHLNRYRPRRLARTGLLLACAAWTCVSALPGKDSPGQDPSDDLGDMSLEQLGELEAQTVVAASRFQQDASRAPASITVLSREDILNFGWRTLGDALASVPGVHLRYDRFYDYIGNRGFSRPGDYNSRTLVLINGHRVNDIAYQQGSVGTELPLDLDLVERIEVIRGPSASLYGSSAIFGVVNIITRGGRELQGGESTVKAGAWGFRQGRLSYGDHLPNGWDFLVSATSSAEDGGDTPRPPTQRISPQNRALSTAGLDYQRALSGFARLSKGGFTLEAGWGRRTKGVPPLVYWTDLSPKSFATDERGYILARAEGEWLPDTNFTVELSYDHYRYKGLFHLYFEGDWMPSEESETGWAWVPNPDPRLSLLPTTTGRWWGALVQARHRFLGKQSFTAGLEYSDSIELSGDRRNYDTGESYASFSISNRVFSPYAQLDLDFGHGFGLSAGLRHDRYNTVGSTTNPRLALLWQGGRGTTLKLLYGRSFRAPHTSELYPEIGYEVDPHLRPERNSNWELVWEQRLGDAWRLATSAYAYRTRGLIGAVLGGTSEEPVYVFTNLGAADGRGVEVALHGLVAKWVNLRVSYTHQHVSLSDGTRPTDSPEHLLKINATGDLWRKYLRAGLETIFTSSRLSLDQGDGSRQRTGPQWVHNLTLRTGTALAPFSLSLSVNNLLGSSLPQVGSQMLVDTYSDPNQPAFHSLVPAPPRSIRLSASWEF